MSSRTKVSPPPPQKSKAPGDKLPPLPPLHSTYTRIIVGAIMSARGESGFTRRVKAATRQLAAMVPATKEHFNALSLLGKALTVALLLALGGGLTYGGLLLRAPSPEQLRQDIRATLASGDFVKARRLLERLRNATGGLKEGDRWQLEAPVEAALEKQRKALQAGIEVEAKAGRWAAALVKLDDLDSTGFAPEWAMYIRAEVLRLAGRSGEAIDYYGRYVQLYPGTERTDDALFWEAAMLRDAGKTKEAKELLARLLAEYPGTNFKSSAKRLLAEIEGPAHK